MPAVKYDYNYARMNKSNQGVASRARSNYAYNNMSAQRKVSSNYAATQRANNNSNSARKQRRYNHADIDIPVVVKKKVELEKPEELKLTKPKGNTATNNKSESAKKSIIITLLAFTMLFVICTRYAQINELTHKVSSLEKDLASAESLNQQLSAEVDSKTDLSYIEKYAKYQLGMQKPDEKQVVRIAYDKQDRISTPIVIEESKEPSLIDRIIKDIKNLVD